MYIETSWPRTQGDTAMLLSDRIKANPYFNWCLTFWYHIYGNSAGALAVLVRKRPYSVYGGYMVRIWETAGNQGDQWHWQQVQINSGVHFQVCIGIAFTSRFQGSRERRKERGGGRVRKTENTEKDHNSGILFMKNVARGTRTTTTVFYLH